MALLSSAQLFWKTMKSVSVPDIHREAHRDFAIALVGDIEQRTVVRKHLQGVHPETLVPLQEYDSVSAESGYPQESGSFDITIDAGNGRRDNTPSGNPIYSVKDLGDWTRTAARILDDRPDLALSLARRFPGFRPAVSERLIRDTSMANAQLAMINALPGVVPILAILLPVTAVGDIFLLTKNQAMMLYRMAAAHDLPLDTKTRSRDLAPLLGNAFGWRAIARELVGAIPGGVGLTARGAIAYAGTYALGKALLGFYQTGKEPGRAQLNRYYQDIIGEAKKRVRAGVKT